MKHPFKFVLTPLEGKRYVTERDNIVVNVGIENAKYVNRYGVVKQIPYTYEGKIKVGDTVIVHHNVFRDVFDVNGDFKHSNSNVADDIYLVLEDNIFMFHNGEKWECTADNCFVKPSTHEPLTGYICFSNVHRMGERVGFTPESEYEFYIDGDILYKMRERDIAVIHEEPEW